MYKNFVESLDHIFSCSRFRSLHVSLKTILIPACNPLERNLFAELRTLDPTVTAAELTAAKLR